jgi:hypothetical protein
VLTEHQTIKLILGHDWFEKSFASEEAERAAWHEHKEELLARRGEFDWTHYAHGTRPWVWWKYEKHAPRRQIAGEPVQAMSTDLYEGVPRLWNGDTNTVRFESQYAYLKRLGLLFPGEAELVRDQEKWDD